MLKTYTMKNGRTMDSIHLVTLYQQETLYYKHVKSSDLWPGCLLEMTCIQNQCTYITQQHKTWRPLQYCLMTQLSQINTWINTNFDLNNSKSILPASMSKIIQELHGDCFASFTEPGTEQIFCLIIQLQSQYMLLVVAGKNLLSCSSIKQYKYVARYFSQPLGIL